MASVLDSVLTFLGFRQPHSSDEQPKKQPYERPPEPPIKIRIKDVNAPQYWISELRNGKVIYVNYLTGLEQERPPPGYVERGWAITQDAKGRTRYYHVYREQWSDTKPDDFGLDELQLSVLATLKAHYP